MKKILAVLLAVLMLAGVVGCGSGGNGTDRIAVAKLNVLTIVDDYIAGDMSFNGASQKIKTYDDEIKEIDKNDYSLSMVNNYFQMDESYVESVISLVELMNYRDHLAVSIDRPEKYGTSAKEEGLKQNTNNMETIVYDHMLSDAFCYGTLECHIYVYKHKKNSPKTIHVSLWFSSSTDDYVWAAFGAAAAWVADIVNNSENTNMIVTVNYNGKPILKLTLEDGMQWADNTQSFSDSYDNTKEKLNADIMLLIMKKLDQMYYM